MEHYPDVDTYLEHAEGWPDEIAELRSILLDCGLDEEIKWGKPCYSDDGRNLAIMQEMKNFLALMFFKGALLDDPDEVLQAQGPNSRSARRIEFTSVDDVNRLADTVRRLVAAAIDVEDAGIEVGPPPALEPVEELQERLDRDPEFRAAFDALTPGRQREYNLYFSDAKQATTRRSRIDKYAPKILDGKGFRDR
ncbi:YdeI/OmpD-associated family protein [Ilumatobacter nonamiensis]|uniref:YdeI/OmpD-associated family protein n=1 Tax=Ilumatobacter nonamiensis TaxID=467093 RepID=UPI00034C112E|nr:YdeI/OmpD-associated family protein [Ilumatobacter nonamiensis]